MLYQICISLYTLQTCIPNCPVSLLLQVTWDNRTEASIQQQRLLLIPPRKMHAFKFLLFVRILTVFRERDNVKMTTVQFSFIPGVSQYNSITSSCSLNQVLQLFQGTFYIEVQYKKTRCTKEQNHPTNTEDSCHCVPSILSI